MFTRARLPGLWIPGSTISRTELEHIDDYYYALDSRGGTYSLGAALILGGAGVTFADTAHNIQSGGRINIESGGELRVKNSGLLRLDGTAGDIKLEVIANAATITCQTGTNLLGNSGSLMQWSGAATFAGAVTCTGASTVTLQSGCTATLASGATLTLVNGSTTDIAGAANVKSAGVLTVESGGDLIGASGSYCQWSGALDLAGDTTFTGSKWPLLSSRNWTRPGRILHVLSYAGASTGPADPDIWTEISDAFDAPCYRTSDRETSGGKSLIEFTDLPVGATISNVTITTKGTHPLGVVSTLPTYRIVSWLDSAAAAYTNHSSIVTDTHTMLAFPATDDQTTVTASAAQTVVAGRRYGLKITHPYQSTETQGMRIYEVTMNGTLESMEL